MNMISTDREKHFIVDILFVLVLFGVFTVSALMLVMIGSEVYRRTVEDMSNNYETRTSVAYITEKIRQNDTAPAENTSYMSNSISLSTLSGEPALVLTQNMNGETYCTYLYLYNGYLRELFIKAGSYPGEDTLAAGQEIMELSALHMTQATDNLFSIQLTTPDGDTHSIFVSPHCALPKESRINISERILP